MPRLIGDAYIALLPDASMFRPDADAKIKAALSGLRPTVKITGDATDVNAKIAAIAAALKGLNTGAALDLSTGRALGDVASLGAAIDGLIRRLDGIPVTLDDSKSLARLYSLIAGADALGKQLEDLGDADFDINRALAKFYALDAQAKALQADMSALTPDMDTTRMTGKVAIMAADVEALRSALSDMRASTDDTAFLAKIVSMQAATLKLARNLNNMPASADTLPFEADILKMTASVGALQAKMSSLGNLGSFANLGKVASASPLNPLATFGQVATMNALGDATVSLNRALDNTAGIAPIVTAAMVKMAAGESMIIANGGGGWWGWLNNQIRVFGGALEGLLPDWLANIHVWHLFTDAIFEFAAAWAPALIAVGAFAAYAFPVGEKIYGQWKNINTILDGTGGNLTDLGTSFDTIERAIEPSIMVAFGEYMAIIGHNATGLGDALTKVGAVIDRWSAQAAGSIGSFEKSFDSIIGTGAKDFAEIGYGFEELGKILDNLFVHDMPGYVHILLALGDAALTAMSDFIQFAGPAIKIGLAIHGFIVYAGLATTAIFALSRAIVAGGMAKYLSMIGMGASQAGIAAEESAGKFNSFGVAIGSMAGFLAAGAVNSYKYVAGLVALTGAEGIAAAATKLFGDTMSIIPFGAMGLAIGAVVALVGVGLYIAFKNSTDAAAKFNKEMQSIVTASNAADIGTNIANSIAATSAEMATLAKNTTQVSAATAGAVRGINTAGHALNDLQQQQQEAIAGQQQLITQGQNYGARMAQLSTIFGSTSAALSGLNLMGVSAGKVATDTNAAWATQLGELKALAAGYGYMSQSGSAATAQLNALNISTGTVTKNVQTLTQAEAAWVSMISSGDSAFTGFEQGQATLSGAMNLGAKSGDTLRVTLGKLSETFPLLKTSLNGTTQSALAARQAFDSQLTSGVTLFGNLQMLATASGDTAKAQSLLADGGKAIIAQMLPFVAGSKQGVAELSSLAQVMGGPATDSFQTLAKWVGTTKGAENTLNNVQAQLTISASNLTTAEKNLGNVLDTAVTGAQANAIAKTINLQTVTDALATSVEKGGKTFSSTSLTLAGKYYEALIQAGVGATQAKSDTDAFLTRLGATTGVVDTVNKALAKLPTKVSIAVETTVSAQGAVKAMELGGAGNLAHALLGELQFSGMAAGGTVPGGIHGRDSVPAMLAPGELVVPASHAARFGDMARRASIPGFAAGGMVGPTLTDITAGLGKIVPTVGAAAGSFAQGTTQAFVNAVTKSAISMATGVLPGGAPVTSPVLQHLIAEALNADHAPQSWLPAIELMVSKESGGNANAIDPVSVLGEHATGLMQMLPTTFGMYSQGNIMNPLTNLEAAIKYIMADYGSPFNIQGIGRAGTYRGYSGGGAINEPVNGVGLWSGMGYSFAENGQPEYVSNGSQASAAGGGGMQGATNIGQQALINQNNQIIKLLAGLPQIMGRAITQSAGAGMKAGYYSAQN